MRIKEQAIRDQFKPLDFFFDEQRPRFKASDIDLIDKAERYFQDALSGKFAAEKVKYEIPEKVKKLMKFVEWAEKRGGDAFFVDVHEKPIDELTEEEKEMKKPFYARTYYVGQ